MLLEKEAVPEHMILILHHIKRVVIAKSCQSAVHSWPHQLYIPIQTSIKVFEGTFCYAVSEFPLCVCNIYKHKSESVLFVSLNHLKY